MASFDNKKELRFVITLGSGTFGSSNSNQITLEGYRAVVDIDRGGGQMAGTLRAQIFGVSQSDMNSCVTYPFQPSKLSNGVINMNTVQVYAIDGDQETLVFTGNIVIAWGNYRNMPDVFLEIQAQSTYVSKLSSVPPLSFNGTIDVATAMGSIATQMGLTLENNGVNAKLQNQYLPNTAFEQMKALAQAAGVWWYIDNTILAITPAYQPRNNPGGEIPLISAETGMRGYPTFDSTGVNFQTIFNPAIIFGASFEIQSAIPQASGVWIASNIAHKLESEKLDGSWFSAIKGTKTGLVVTR